MTEKIQDASKKYQLQPSTTFKKTATLGQTSNGGSIWEKTITEKPSKNIPDKVVTTDKLFKIKNPTLNPNLLQIPEQEIKAHSFKIIDQIKEFNALKNAPSPELTIKGIPVITRVVVDKKTHKTFVYDDNGKFIKKFPDAVGNSSTPTPSGSFYVTRIGETPYKTSDDTPKVKKKPYQYGPNIIYERMLDKPTGKTSITGVFLHGTHVPSSIGKDASHGCVRHNNKDIKELVKYVKPGDLITIK